MPSDQPANNHSAALLREQLLELDSEMALAREFGLTDNATYMAALASDVAVTKAAYIGAAVTEIATLRAAFDGPLIG